MFKFGIFNTYWSNDWQSDLIEDMKRSKNLGLDILEFNALNLHRMNQASRLALGKAAEDLGMELTCCIGLGSDWDISSEDNATRQKGIEYLDQSTRYFQEVGVKVCGGIFYGAWNAQPLPDPDFKARAIQHSQTSIKQILPRAMDAGVVYSVEVVNRFEQFMLNTTQEGLNYVREIDHPNLKIHLDTFHMNIEEDSMTKAVLDAGELLGHFHAGENNRRLPLESDHSLDWKAIIDALKDTNYHQVGCITLEPFVIKGGQVGKDVSLYRDLYPQEANWDDLLKQSLSYIKSLC